MQKTLQSSHQKQQLLFSPSSPGGRLLRRAIGEEKTTQTRRPSRMQRSELTAAKGDRVNYNWVFQTRHVNEKNCGNQVSGAGSYVLLITRHSITIL